jgi:hypothetical protein
MARTRSAIAAMLVDSFPSPTLGSVGSRCACASFAKAQATSATRETAATWADGGTRLVLLYMAHIPSIRTPLIRSVILQPLRGISLLSLSQDEVDYTHPAELVRS